MEPAPEVLARVAEIASDNRSGADTLARKAAEVLELQAAAPSTDGTGLREALAEAARLLVAAQPAMASIFNLANAVLFAIEGVDDAPSLRNAVISTCRGFTAKIARVHEVISEAAREEVPDGGTVLTHSYSSTVADALLGAWRCGRRFSVICTESRPLCEGVSLARTLAAAHIPVTLIADAALHHHFQEASLALSGADTVAREGVLNKAGTALVALSARARRKKFLVLAGTHKWLAPARRLVWVRRENPREILPEDIAGICVSNVYFDLTPLRLVTALITQQGALPPAAVRERLGELKVHPALVGRRAAPAA
jgi:ribose 1,5-bisphosphate isomerase